MSFEDGCKIAFNIACDLMYHGYGFDSFMSYQLTQSIEEIESGKCKDIWNKALNKMERM